MIKEQFVQIYEQSFKENWDKNAFSDYDSNIHYTYAQVAIKIAQIHLLFENLNIQKGDKVALIGKNSSNWAITYLATVTYGAVIVPILSDFNPIDIHYIINHSDSVLLFSSDNIWKNLQKKENNKIRAVFSLNDFSCLEQKNDEKRTDFWDEVNVMFQQKYPFSYLPEHVIYPLISNQELVSINYTSGTTGFSKGVLTPANALAGNVTFGIKTRLLDNQSRVLCFLPMAHAYGCAFEFLTATAVGAHITFLGKTPSPQILLKAFSDIKPSVIFSVPLILEKIYKKQILPIINKKEIRILLKVPILNQIVYTKIRRKLTDAFGGSFSQVIVGGAPLNKEVEDFLLKIKFPITVGYGMTECAPLISFSVYTEFTPSSAGKVLDTMQVKILSADPCQEVGEICVKGENLMLGYYKNEDATKEIIDEQGWLHTGDLGLLAKNGTVFIKGRSKSLILSPSGQNIDPEEIESKLNNMPYISESIVVQNDGKLIALVFLDKDMLDSENISSDNILMLMQNNLKELNNVVAHYEKISEIKIHPTEFEKTPKKSIKRFLYNA